MLDHNLYEAIKCSAKTMWGEQDQWIPGNFFESLADMLKDSCKEFFGCAGCWAFDKD